MGEEQSPGFTYPDLRRQSEIEVWQGGICVVLDWSKDSIPLSKLLPETGPRQGDG